MTLPNFYAESISEHNKSATLDEDTSRHIVQVLRMKAGEQLQLTNGKGELFFAQIVAEQKKAVEVRINSTASLKAPAPRIVIAISLVKNTNRFEWFLEKATEIGVSEVVPLICERTENHHFRLNRMRNILISAMLQSRQGWLPLLTEPITFKNIVEQFDQPQKFIAHCEEDKKGLLSHIIRKDTDALLLIGPEGDFTKKEIELSSHKNFTPVSLGETRLRTETAGIVAVTIMRNANYASSNM